MRKNGGEKTAASSVNRQKSATSNKLNHQRIDDIDKERTDHRHDRNAMCDGPKRSVIACMLAIALALHRGQSHSDPQPALPHRIFAHHAPGNEDGIQRHEDGLTTRIASIGNASEASSHSFSPSAPSPGTTTGLRYPARIPLVKDAVKAHH